MARGKLPTVRAKGAGDATGEVKLRTRKNGKRGVRIDNIKSVADYEKLKQDLSETGVRGGSKKRGRPYKTYYCIDEYYHDGRKQGQLDEELNANNLIKLLDKHDCNPEFVRSRLERMYCDPSAKGFISHIYRRGICEIWKANNKVLDGIRATNLAINKGLIKFNDCCKEMIKEFGGYLWDDTCPEERPLKFNDHAMDAIRYFVASQGIVSEHAMMRIG